MDATEIIKTIVINLVIALPGLIALGWQIYKDRKKMPQEEMTEGIRASKDAAEIIRQYSEEIRGIRSDYNNMKKEVDTLRDQLKEKDDLIDEWKIGIERLIAQLVSLGHKPVWEPKTQPLKPLT